MFGYAGVFIDGHRLFLIVVSRGYSLVVVCGLLMAVVSLLWSMGSRARRLQ